MTNQEAIDRILDHMVVHKMAEKHAVKITEALRMAMNALKEKQPIEIQSNGFGLACCPKCSAVIEDITSDGKRVGFCRICGQPVRWKENNRKDGDGE